MDVELLVLLLLPVVTTCVVVGVDADDDAPPPSASPSKGERTVKNEPRLVVEEKAVWGAEGKVMVVGSVSSASDVAAAVARDEVEVEVDDDEVVMGPRAGEWKNAGLMLLWEEEG